jgi:hypothetical protein
LQREIERLQPAEIVVSDKEIFNAQSPIPIQPPTSNLQPPTSNLQIPLNRAPEPDAVDTLLPGTCARRRIT